MKPAGGPKWRILSALLFLLFLSACFQIAPVAPPEADLSALATPAYLADFQSSSTTSVLSSIKVGSGVIFRGTGSANTKTITVIGKRYLNGTLQSTQLAKVVSVYSSKRLGVVSSSTSSTLNSQGGVIGFVFAPTFNTAGVNVASIKVSNVTTSGGVIKLYPVSGATKTITLATTGAGVTKTITLNASGIKAMDVIAKNAFTVDDVAFDTALALPPDPGTAGKATVAGIDSNANGLRDDVERYVALTYASDKPTLDIFNAYAKLLQSAVTKTQTATSLTTLRQQTIQLTYCLRRWRPDTAKLDEQKFLYAFYNTDARYFAEKNLVIGTPGTTFSIDDSLLANCSAEVRSKLTSSSYTLGASAASNEIIFFINGIDTSFEEGVVNVEALVQKTGKRVKLLHNQTNGVAFDLIESVAQKFKEPKYTWRDWKYKLTPANHESKITYWASLLSNAVTSGGTTANQAKIRAAFDQYNKQNFKITVVSHSQGNLFANQLTRALLADKSVPKKDGKICGYNVVAVASPANEKIRGGFHITVIDDRIIRPIPDSLPALFANPISYRQDFFNHSFIETYLNGPSTGPAITKAINSAFTNMIYPNDCKGNEYIGVFTHTSSYIEETVSTWTGNDCQGNNHEVTSRTAVERSTKATGTFVMKKLSNGTWDYQNFKPVGGSYNWKDHEYITSSPNHGLSDVLEVHSATYTPTQGYGPTMSYTGTYSISESHTLPLCDGTQVDESGDSYEKASSIMFVWDNTMSGSRIDTDHKEQECGSGWCTTRTWYIRHTWNISPK